LANLQAIKTSCTESKVLETNYCKLEIKSKELESEELEQRVMGLTSAFCSDINHAGNTNFNYASIKIISRPVQHWSKRFNEQEIAPVLLKAFEEFPLWVERGVGTWKME
jgi:hypothetical protein